MANLSHSSVSISVFDLDLPIAILQAIQSHPDGHSWLRQVIIAAAEQELLGRSLSQTVKINLTTSDTTPISDHLKDEPVSPNPLPIGSLVRDLQRHLGYVQYYNETTGRYTVQLNSGRVNDYPHRMLTFIEGPETAKPEMQ